MAKQKNDFKFYVRMYINGENFHSVRYVTAHNGSYLEWKEEEKPLAMEERRAVEIWQRLTINGQACDIIYQPDYMVENQNSYINGWLDKMINKAVEYLKQQEQKKE